MTAAAIVLFVAAAAIWTAPLAAVAALFTWDWFACRGERQANEALETTPEWLALLAATEDTPVYDALVCESIEKAEGWA